MTSKIFIYISGTVLLLIGCNGLTFVAQSSPSVVMEPTWTMNPPPSPTELATITPILFPTDIATGTPSLTLIPTSTFTPTLTPQPQSIMQGPGDVVVPILLYHQIGTPSKDNPYYVSIEAFEQQMYLLHEWGYATMSVELLAQGIKAGAELPPKPIILTFDDGGETIFTNALPVMQKYNFTGTAYIVYNYIGITNYMDVDQIRGLYAAGWEIGSHSISHQDLIANPNRQMEEIVQSRLKLQALLGLPVLSFAYPFGAYNGESVHYAHFAGYIAALGLGKNTVQGENNLFYLYRKEVDTNQNLETFASFLPWREDLTNLPFVTIVP